MKSAMAALGLLFLAASAAYSQDARKHDMADTDHAVMKGKTGPREGGQAAFAAIQEIVALLEADSETDWSKVNIEALRQHLIDMNNVTLGAVVDSVQAGNSTDFKVTGEGEAKNSVKRMIVAHDETMNGVDGWSFTAKEDADGATLTVTPPDAATAQTLVGLGFIGVMARGMHHQTHHMALASGATPHGG